MPPQVAWPVLSAVAGEARCVEEPQVVEALAEVYKVGGCGGLWGAEEGRRRVRGGAVDCKNGLVGRGSWMPPVGSRRGSPAPRVAHLDDECSAPSPLA